MNDVLIWCFSRYIGSSLYVKEGISKGMLYPGLDRQQLFPGICIQKRHIFHQHRTTRTHASNKQWMLSYHSKKPWIILWRLWKVFGLEISKLESKPLKNYVSIKQNDFNSAGTRKVLLYWWILSRLSSTDICRDTTIHRHATYSYLWMRGTANLYGRFLFG